MGTVRRDDARGEDANDGGIVDDDDDDDVIASSGSNAASGWTTSRAAAPTTREEEARGEGAASRRRRLTPKEALRLALADLDASGWWAVISSGIVFGTFLLEARTRVQPRNSLRLYGPRHSVVHGHHLDGFVDVD